jgi:hypothetical protein
LERTRPLRPPHLVHKISQSCRLSAASPEREEFEFLPRPPAILERACGQKKSHNRILEEPHQKRYFMVDRYTAQEGNDRDPASHSERIAGRFSWLPASPQAVSAVNSQIETTSCEAD